MRDLIASGELGTIYSCRMFYGNGTARLVRDSAWRDQGAGVLPDLGSHLLDTCRFWFGDIEDKFQFVGVHGFENRAPDHVVIHREEAAAADRIGNDASDVAQPFHLRHPRRARFGAYSVAVQMGAVAVHQAHAGPAERTSAGGELTLVQDDPTWALEYTHFKSLCSSGAKTDLANDIWLHRVLQRLSAEAAAPRGAR